MGLNLTSELEAVNKVLRMMGEAPVNSLAGQFGLAKQAHDTLKETSRLYQELSLLSLQRNFYGRCRGLITKLDLGNHCPQRFKWN